MTGYRNEMDAWDWVTRRSPWTKGLEMQGDVKTFREDRESEWIKNELDNGVRFNQKNRMKIMKVKFEKWSC